MVLKAGHAEIRIRCKPNQIGGVQLDLRSGTRRGLQVISRHQWEIIGGRNQFTGFSPSYVHVTLHHTNPCHGILPLRRIRIRHKRRLVLRVYSWREDHTQYETATPHVTTNLSYTPGANAQMPHNLPSSMVENHQNASKGG